MKLNTHAVISLLFAPFSGFLPSFFYQNHRVPVSLLNCRLSVLPPSHTHTHTPPPSLAQVGIEISHHSWIPFLLHPSPSTLCPLWSSNPIEVFVLGLVKTLFALCRKVYILRRDSAEVCPSPISLSRHNNCSCSSS